MRIKRRLLCFEEIVIDQKDIIRCFQLTTTISITLIKIIILVALRKEIIHIPL